MVTMQRFGNYGRLGNCLFQWAFLSSLARKKGVDLILPDNEIFQYFKVKPLTGKIEADITYEEQHYEFNLVPYENLDYTKNINFLGYWQNEKYFDKEVRKEINFKHEYHQQVREKFKHLFERPTIAIGIRRTDYLTGPQVYYNLPPSYYITALIKHFPEWRNHNLVFISDDLDYCKLHFQCLPNAYFPETKDIEQMCLMSQCDNHIIGNSTFHWWAAWIGEKEYGKIVQPNHLFIGSLLEKYGNIDFYSERWIRHEHEGRKIDLKDVTFTIPVMYDHPDRKINLEICLQLLSEFDTNIIIGEQGTDQFSNYPNYIKFSCTEFHRTKMLNEMAAMASTPIIANWDCDVAVPPMQLLETVHRIRQGVEMAYPYEFNFIRISYKVKDEIKNRYDLGDYAKYHFPNNDSKGKPSFGGAVLWNKQKYFEIGGENEYFISFGPEDIERMERAVKLGVNIERIPGNLYHFPHFVGPNSSQSNPHFKRNRALLDKERLMTKDKLLDWISSWEWHSPYTPDYYDQIVDEAVISREEIFRTLSLDGNSIVIDLGCGVGQWGVNMNNYIGVDYRVPQDKLLIKNYVEHDLRTELNGKLVSKTNTDSGIFKLYQTLKAGVVICVEVAEHLEEKYADILVDNITSCCEAGGLIIFSAAVPFQGGNNHVNCQWQTWWADKFYERGFGGRQYEEIQNNKRICLWYRNNVAVYCRHWNNRDVKDFVLPEYYYEIAKHLTKMANK